MTFLEWLKQEGKALVIQGPQGCGKGLLAVQLAQETGAYAYATLGDITGRQPRSSYWLSSRPKTVIVDGSPTLDDLETMKALIASTKVTCNRKGKDPETIDSPTFIFCTSDPESLSFGEYDRRFYVIKMDIMENRL